MEARLETLNSERNIGVAKLLAEARIYDIAADNEVDLDQIQEAKLQTFLESLGLDAAPRDEMGRGDEEDMPMSSPDRALVLDC